MYSQILQSKFDSIKMPQCLINQKHCKVHLIYFSAATKLPLAPIFITVFKVCPCRLVL